MFDGSHPAVRDAPHARRTRSHGQLHSGHDARHAIALHGGERRVRHDYREAPRRARHPARARAVRDAARALPPAHAYRVLRFRGSDRLVRVRGGGAEGVGDVRLSLRRRLRRAPAPARVAWCGGGAVLPAPSRRARRLRHHHRSLLRLSHPVCLRLLGRGASPDPHVVDASAPRVGGGRRSGTPRRRSADGALRVVRRRCRGHGTGRCGA